MSPNPNDPRHPWARLTSAARMVRDERDASAPFGFATRVAALALAQEFRVASLFERFSLRAMGLAALLAVVSVALNYQELAAPAAVAQAAEEIDLVHSDDAVSIVLDLTAD
ncbi:MAG: hypothetical protein JNL39_05690 [Opitutaceae bacterium]|nr:hypothetical protein [Opitutaceae bacterium]